MPFKKGRTKSGGIKKGGKHKKTILKEKLGIETVEKIDQLAPTAINNLVEFLSSDDNNVRLAATKEILKYLFPTKRQVETTVKDKRIEDIIKESQDDLSNLTVGKDGIKQVEGH